MEEYARCSTKTASQLLQKVELLYELKTVVKGDRYG